MQGHLTGPQKRPLATRYWEKVEKTEGCWLWVGNIDSRGYGRIGRGGRSGGNHKTHRLAWQFAFGEIPAGMSVLHRCDVRNCVNPAHLFLGTPADNSSDMARKGRSPNRKLTEAQVVEIRRRFAAGERSDDLAFEYAINRTTVYDITNRKIWREVA